MRSATFPQGGIRPPDRKRRTRDLPSWNAILPRTSIVGLLQHDGRPARSRVSAGDRVREGQLIGRADGSPSANVHAPIPGIVREVRRIVVPGTPAQQAVVIDMDGEFDRLGKQPPSNDWKLDATTLLRLIEEGGVVGMGGSSVPTHLSLRLPQGRACETLVVNGSESEPYLSADNRLMVERTTAVLTGARIAARIVGAARIVVAVEANKRPAIAALASAADAGEAPIEIVRLRVKYPQGDERQLVRAVIGREIPSGGSPIDVGAITVDVSTAAAVYDAVVHRHPLVERIVTVSGGAIARPANVKVRVGTPIAELLTECGGLTGNPARIISGGPMIGHAITDLQTPITKITRGVLALTRAEVHSAPQTACIQCGRCVDACPMGLSPTRLAKLIEHGETDVAVAEGLFDCTECGACGYICPARIPLVETMRQGKSIARRRGAS